MKINCILNGSEVKKLQVHVTSDDGTILGENLLHLTIPKDTVALEFYLHDLEKLRKYMLKYVEKA